MTVLHRGRTCGGAPGVEHLHADRDADLSVLGDRRWDATLDTCAYWPGQVESLAAALRGRGGRQLLISTVSVYDDLPHPGFTEDAPLRPALGLDGARPPVTGDTYGRLKVGCEQAAVERYGRDLLVLRPTYLIGPHDHTGRFPAWVECVARGGELLAPGRPSAPLQYLDVRDLAQLCVTLLEGGATGTIHTTAPAITWADLMDDLLAAVAPAGATVTWVPSAWLVAQGVTGQELPLWVGSDEPAYLLALDPGRALAAGLTPRPLPETIADTAAWLNDPALADPPTRLGLAPERAAALLAQWHQA